MPVGAGGSGPRSERRGVVRGEGSVFRRGVGDRRFAEVASGAAVVLVLLLVVGSKGSGRHMFVDVATPAMADGESIARGACWADVDGDGDQDLFVAATDGVSRLWRNEGGGAFTEMTTASLGEPVRKAQGCAFVDLDNDGDPDLFVTTNNRRGDGQNRLFRNLGGAGFGFAPVSVAPASAAMRGIGAASSDWADYDGDGDYDGFVAARVGPKEARINALLEQTGPFVFRDVAPAKGVARFDAPPYTFLGSWFDYDRDGDLDLLLAIDFWGVELFRNDAGTLRRVTREALPHATDKTPGAPPNNAMGVTWGDYDNDGCMDLFVTGSNFAGQGGFGADTLGDLASRLYRNHCNGTFSDVTRAAGMRITGVVEWSANFIDFDNDGDLDLSVVAGNVGERTTVRSPLPTRILTALVGIPRRLIPAHIAAWAYRYEAMIPAISGTGPAAAMPNFLYRNQLVESGRPVFVDVTRRAGVNEMGSTQGSGWADMDNDGDLDWFVPNRGTRNRLYRNDGPVGNYLRVHLVGARLPSAVGAWVKIRTGKRWQIRHVHILDGYLSQSQLDPHFGLGEVLSVDEVLVRWPGEVAWRRHCGPVPANRTVTVTEDAGCR